MKNDRSGGRRTVVPGEQTNASAAKLSLVVTNNRTYAQGRSPALPNPHLDHLLCASVSPCLCVLPTPKLSHN